MNQRPISITKLVYDNQRRLRAEAHEQRWGRPVIQREPYEPPQPVETWPDSKIVAILRCLRNERAKDCLAHLATKGVEATQADFTQLRTEGLAYKRELAWFHELTPQGTRWAERAVALIAQRFELHHIVMRGDGSSAGAKCACGWRCSFERKYFGENQKVQRAINEHLSDPDAWKRALQSPALLEAQEQIGKLFTGGGDG